MSRRAMLRGAGVSIALPVLEAMLDRRGLLWGTAEAKTTTPPVRLFVVFYAVGTNMGRQAGDSTIDDWTPPDHQSMSYTYNSFTTAQYRLSNALLPLGSQPYMFNGSMVQGANVQGDVNIIGGLESVGARNQYVTDKNDPKCSHRMGAGVVWTGMPPNGQYNVSGPSLDQKAVQLMGYNGTNQVTRFPSLNAGVPCGSDTNDPCNVISWSGPGQPNPPVSNPLTLFQSMFCSGQACATGASTTMTSQAQLQTQDDKSVLDFVASDIGALQAKLGRNDQMTLAAHLQAIREIETGLTIMPTSTSASCTNPSPVMSIPDGTDGLENFNTRVPLQIQLLTLALQCDLTRVVTLGMGPAMDHSVYEWLGQTQDHHTLSHLPGQYNDQIIAYTQWNVQRFTDIVNALKGIPDPLGGSGSTLLDNSVVVMNSEVGDGDLHSYDNLPILVAGGAGGAFSPGRYIQYPWNCGTGTSSNGLYASILTAMTGQPQTFGVDAAGPLTGLSG